MIYKTYYPGSKLSQYVSCYWTLANNDKSLPITKDRIFPDGCIELVFHFGDLFKKYKPDNSFELQSRSFIHGQLTEFIELEATGKIGIFSIRFYPNGLKHFVPFGVNEITGHTVSVSDIWGSEGDELEDMMLNTRSDHQRISIIEAFLMNHLNQNVKDNLLVEHCVKHIERNNGNISIDLLADSLSIGRRQLERKFISSVGLTPKSLSRIIRFNNILRLIEDKQFTSLTMVAYEGGFYDQSHFIKDFKEFTGLNPRQYFSENLPLVRYFNL